MSPLTPEQERDVAVEKLNAWRDGNSTLLARVEELKRENEELRAELARKEGTR